MHEAFALSTELYKYWHLVFQRRTVKIVCQDGRILDDTLPSKFSPKNSQIANATFDWEKWWIISSTTRGHRIITEGFNPNSPPPFNGRASVYLDQNRWRTVADALHDPERIADPGERQAAQDLIQLALDGGIVLPLSMGHMLETAGLHNERRYEVGVAMASLAGGWQIRNPLDLWKQEAELTIRDQLGLPNIGRIYPIVTEPGALFGSDSKMGIAKEMTDVDTFIAMLTMPNVILGMLIDPKPLPKHPLTMWIDHHTRITSRMDAENVPKNQRRQLARRRYWNENIAFYTAPYRKLTRSTDFPTFSDREVASLLSASPMVGLLSELFVRRFKDRQNKWRRNDLIDIFHLSSAAAYADYVCAEKHTGTQLREAQRALGRDETVFTSLGALVRAIRRDGLSGRNRPRRAPRSR